jgi:hypothetical protein
MATYYFSIMTAILLAAAAPAQLFTTALASTRN